MEGLLLCIGKNIFEETNIFCSYCVSTLPVIYSSILVDLMYILCYSIKDYVLHGLTLLCCRWFIYLFGVLQVISRRVLGRAEETSTYSSLGFCTVNCRPTASNYQLSHLRPSQGSNPGLRGGRRECYHSATVAPICCRVMNKEL